MSASYLLLKLITNANFITATTFMLTTGIIWVNEMKDKRRSSVTTANAEVQQNMTVYHVNVLVLTWFWKTARPCDVTPSCTSSLLWSCTDPQTNINKNSTNVDRRTLDHLPCQLKQTVCCADAEDTSHISQTGSDKSIMLSREWGSRPASWGSLPAPWGSRPTPWGSLLAPPHGAVASPHGMSIGENLNVAKE